MGAGDAAARPAHAAVQANAARSPATRPSCPNMHLSSGSPLSQRLRRERGKVKRRVDSVGSCCKRAVTSWRLRPGSREYVQHTSAASAATAWHDRRRAARRDHHSTARSNGARDRNETSLSSDGWGNPPSYSKYPTPKTRWRSGHEHQPPFAAAVERSLAGKGRLSYTAARRRRGGFNVLSRAPNGSRQGAQLPVRT